MSGSEQRCDKYMCLVFHSADTLKIDSESRSNRYQISITWYYCQVNCVKQIINKPQNSQSSCTNLHISKLPNWLQTASFDDENIWWHLIYNVYKYFKAHLNCCITNKETNKHMCSEHMSLK